MTRCRRVFALACTLLVLGFPLASEAMEPEDIVFQCEDIPPSNYREDGRLKGISVELLGSMWKKMGVRRQPIQVVPWARGYETALDQPKHAVFSMSRTKEREPLFKWVGPIFTARNVFLGRADRNLRIRNLADAKSLKIGTIKDDVVERFLFEEQFDHGRIESVSSLEQNFAKLNLGRIDLVAHSESTLREFIKQENLDSTQFVVLFAFSETPNYYAFHKSTPDSLIERFQKALDASKKDHARLLRKYGLHP